MTMVGFANSLWRYLDPSPRQLRRLQDAPQRSDRPDLLLGARDHGEVLREVLRHDPDSLVRLGDAETAAAAGDGGCRPSPAAPRRRPTLVVRRRRGHRGRRRERVEDEPILKFEGNGSTSVKITRDYMSSERGVPTLVRVLDSKKCFYIHTSSRSSSHLLSILPAPFTA